LFALHLTCSLFISPPLPVFSLHIFFSLSLSCSLSRSISRPLSPLAAPFLSLFFSPSLSHSPSFSLLPPPPPSHLSGAISREVYGLPQEDKPNPAQQVKSFCASPGSTSLSFPPSFVKIPICLAPTFPAISRAEGVSALNEGLRDSKHVRRCANIWTLARICCHVPTRTATQEQVDALNALLRQDPDDKKSQ
jgi:hypothetical protein